MNELEIDTRGGQFQRIVKIPMVLLPPARVISESAVEWTYGFSSLSETTRKSNHLQMSARKGSTFSLNSYFKTLSVGPGWEWNPRNMAQSLVPNQFIELISWLIR